MSGGLPLINDKRSDEELMSTISNRDVTLSRKAFDIIYNSTELARAKMK